MVIQTIINNRRGKQKSYKR